MSVVLSLTPTHESRNPNPKNVSGSEFSEFPPKTVETRHKVISRHFARF